MLFFISPSKNMVLAPTSSKKKSKVDLNVLNSLKNLSETEIKQLMKVNDKLAALNHLRYQNFKEDNIAIKTYSGLQFRQLQLDLYNESQNKFLQNHIRIVSALYGLVKPFDKIGQYRLEMNCPIMINEQPLVEYWKAKLPLKSETIIALTSQEYSQVFSGFNKVVYIHFLNLVDGKLTKPKDIKIKRGRFLNYCILNQIDTISKLKEVSVDGYIFDSSSSKNDYYFIKKI